jgi:hypothetical protein
MDWIDVIETALLILMAAGTLVGVFLIALILHESIRELITMRRKDIE